jgi:hypothetical protein
MILRLIINILAVVGILTLALIVLALWAYSSDEQEIYDARALARIMRGRSGQGS